MLPRFQSKQILKRNFYKRDSIFIIIRIFFSTVKTLEKNFPPFGCLQISWVPIWGYKGMFLRKYSVSVSCKPHERFWGWKFTSDRFSKHCAFIEWTHDARQLYLPHRNPTKDVVYESETTRATLLPREKLSEMKSGSKLSHSIGGYT